ncbi:Lrp/AsnC family transcriptional regulator [Thermoproteota archaeon]
MNLTQNEQKVLKYLIDDGRASDMDIAKKLKISSQAVGKIRKKLEAEHIIIGYETKINLEKLGITTFVAAKLRPQPAIFEKMGYEEFFKSFDKNPHVIAAFRASTNDCIIMMGFRDQKELDLYTKEALAKFGQYVTPLDMEIFSSVGILKKSEKGLLKYVIDSMNSSKKKLYIDGDNDLEVK